MSTASCVLIYQSSLYVSLFSDSDADFRRSKPDDAVTGFFNLPALLLSHYVETCYAWLAEVSVDRTVEIKHDA